MKKILTLFLIASILISMTVSAENDTTLSDAKQTLANIKNAGTNFIPAEKINPITEGISYILTGKSLDWGWQFAVLIFFWIILFFIINSVTSVILNKRIFSLVAALIIATLAMHGIPEKFMDSILISYKSALYAIISALILFAVVTIFNKFFLKGASHSEKMEEAERMGKTIKASAKIEKENLDSYKNEK